MAMKFCESWITKKLVYLNDMLREWIGPEILMFFSLPAIGVV